MKPLLPVEENKLIIVGKIRKNTKKTAKTIKKSNKSYTKKQTPLTPPFPMELEIL